MATWARPRFHKVLAPAATVRCRVAQTSSYRKLGTTAPPYYWLCLTDSAGAEVALRVFFCKKARDTITTVGRGLGSLSKAVLAIMVVRGKLTRCRILVSVLEDAGTATLHLSRAFVALCAEQAVEMLLAKIQQRR